MALTSAFYEAVNSGNVRRVRIMMQDSLLIDPTFVEFNAMEKAAKSMVGLYDVHDGKEFINDRSFWTDEYMDKVMVKVVSNFSHERLDHLKEVVRYLRPVTKTIAPPKEQTGRPNYSSTQQSTYEEEKRRCQEQGDYLGAKIAVGAVIGAAVGGAVTALASAPVAGIIAGVSAGAVVGGVATSVVVGGGKK